MAREGVIKFDLEHAVRPVTEVDIRLLRAWRQLLFRLQLVGQDPQRYDGLGFGNLSMRTPRGFIISGTQTGHFPDPGAGAYAEVVSWELARNRIVSQGLVNPSSESLTHAAVYELAPSIAFVFHVHSPDIWRCVRRQAAAPAANLDASKSAIMDVPETGEGVAYGTPEMARRSSGFVQGERYPMRL